MKNLAPIPEHFTTCIAQRTFLLKNHKDSIEVIAKIGSPIQDVECEDGMDWRCPLKLEYQNTEKVSYACGVDSFQAIDLCINKLVECEIRLMADENKVQIHLFDHEYNFEEYHNFRPSEK